ncbi:anti-sigma-F factor Fin family protein [Rossellomorea vietnamensis]|jgi:hypothetical protein|uniref:Anti-sigma-F factor Fin family protein n=1 Tax=Rossellomorea vietnamensis TaxID=218284 RepID=A0A5D4NI64_9BACI|nr:anti-sigma-F factor Fin family protein [Rossellomorea vietnamensis]TYS13660.1 anti-sigma-F factor Fin family protein [Rossellomorea vietnamensis]
MAIHYHCRHCGYKVGSLNQVSVHSEQVGLHKLSDEDRLDMVSYEQNGDIHIKTICEDCQESLNRNPDYHQSDYLIH